MTSLIKTAIFEASPAVVWAYLTDKDKLGRWYHPARADLAQGQSYALYKAANGPDSAPLIHGRVITFDPPRELVTTFTCDPMNGVETQVQWRLEEWGNGTRLTLEHTGFDALGDLPMGLIMALDAGWDDHLGQMRALKLSDAPAAAA